MYTSRKIQPSLLRRDSVIRSVNRLKLASDRQSVLRNSIEKLVFPIAKNRIADKGIMELTDPKYSTALISHFAELLLQTGDEYRCDQTIIHLNGIADTNLNQTLFLEAVVRQLGKAWSDDSYDFVDITIATSRVQQLVHFLERNIVFTPASKSRGRVEIVSIDGEQHTLMNGILGLIYGTIGWDRSFGSSAAITETSNYFLAENKKELPDVVCFSWSADILYDKVVDLISNYNGLAKSIRPMIIAGGCASERHVAELKSMGVDCICDSIYAAVNISERYRSLRDSHHNLDTNCNQPGPRKPLEIRVNE